MLSSFKTISLLAIAVSSLLPGVLAVPTDELANLEARTADAAKCAPKGFKPLPLCKKPRKRQDWRDMKTPQKHAYINAVKCMMSRRSTSKSVAKSRFDDYQRAHQVLGDEIHFNSQFLPWHRLMIIEYEREMRDKCGYQGASPYWDWSKDIANGGTVKTNPIWDPVTGFGGNGAFRADFNGEQGNNTNVPGWKHDSGGGCIQDGPFKDYRLSIGPGTSNTDRCITRAHNDNFNHFITYEAVNKLMPFTNYTDFWLALEPILGSRAGPGPHGGGHFAGGGTLQDVYSSPGDPIFYLHHANVDRIWWLWQKQNKFANLYAMNGPAFQAPTNVSATLEHVMRMIGVSPDRRIGDVMDIRNTFGCYDYA